MLKFLAEHFANAPKLLVSTLLGNGGTEVNYRSQDADVKSFYLTTILDLKTRYEWGRDNQPKAECSAPRLVQVLSRGCGNLIPHPVRVCCVDPQAVSDIVKNFIRGSRDFGISSLLLDKAVVDSCDDQRVMRGYRHGHNGNKTHLKAARNVPCNPKIFEKSEYIIV